jgi:CheY-like chemotaxis protein
VSDGREAIEKLQGITPDIVLADVFMPEVNGYEVCRYIKQNAKLKHIPVMLLVGSFEPFDEAEARRVGADDILTKPFQSIRRLIDRVGALVTSPPAQQEVVTAELPKNGDKPNGPDGEAQLNTEELKVSTADTQPLPVEMHETIEFPNPVEVRGTETREEMMETVTESQADAGDVLLDLGEYEHADVMDSDDFVLDLEETLDGDVISEPVPMRAFVEPEVSETVASSVGQSYSYQPEIQAASYSAVEEIAYDDQVHEVATEPESKYDTAPIPAPVMVEPEPVVAQVVPASSAASGNLSPEMIDAIARRVVEMMSTKVVQDIAWEVVPDLAELLIKKRLDEKESQTK